MTTMCVNLKNAGQCIFLYKIQKKDKIPMFSFSDANRINILKIEMKDNFYVTLTIENILLAITSSHQTENIKYNEESPFWFSLDAQNKRLYAGIGEPRLETTIFVYLFKI